MPITMFAIAAALALLSTSVDGKEHPQPSPTAKAKWMWGDASLIKGIVKGLPAEKAMHWAAKQNPLRWTKELTLSEVIDSMNTWKVVRRGLEVAGTAAGLAVGVGGVAAVAEGAAVVGVGAAIGHEGVMAVGAAEAVGGAAIAASAPLATARNIRADSPVDIFFLENGETWKFPNVEEAASVLAMLVDGTNVLDGGAQYKPIRCVECENDSSKECCENTLKWMWGDLNRAAKLNPYRWSVEFNFRQAIQNLQPAEAQKRPVRVLMKNIKEGVEYNSVAEAIESLTARLVEEGELWRYYRQLMTWAWGDLNGIQRLNPMRWSKKLNARQLLWDLEDQTNMQKRVEICVDKTCDKYQSVREAIKAFKTATEEEEAGFEPRHVKPEL